MPRIQTGAVIWYSGTPTRLPFRSSGLRMPLFDEMKMQEWRKNGDGNARMAMKSGFPACSGAGSRGLPDSIARVVAVKLGESFGQQLVVENMPGAGGISGVGEVVKAQPDGYTLLVADVGQIAINPHLFSKLPYAPLKDLAPVSMIGTSALYLVAHPSVPVNSLKELVALAKAQPGKLAPAGTPREVVNRLAGEVAKAVKQPDVVQRFTQLGIEPVGSTPEAYAQANKIDYEKYATIVRATGAKID